MVESLIWVAALCGFVVGMLAAIIMITVYMGRRSGRDKD